MNCVRSLLVLGLLVLPVFASPIPGGPCVDGTFQDYLDLGVAGCTAGVGSASVRIEQGWIIRSAATIPDLSAILIQPTFADSPQDNGFDQQFAVSIPGWQGVPGERLVFAITFNVTVNHAVLAIAHTVTSAATGQVQAEVCPGHYFITSVLCAPAATSTVNGTNASVMGVADPLLGTTFGVLGSFDGTLPDGTFGGLTLSTHVTLLPAVAAIPEASTHVLLVIGAAWLSLLKRHIGVRGRARW